MRNIIITLGFLLMYSIAYGQKISGEMNPIGGKEYTYTYTSNKAGENPYGSNCSVGISKGKLRSLHIFGQVSLPAGQRSMTIKVKWDNTTTKGLIIVARQDDASNKELYVNITKDVSVPPTPICTTTTMNNLNITVSKKYTGCVVEIANTTISNNARVEIRGSEYVSIKPPFRAALGTTVYINKRGILEPGPVTRNTLELDAVTDPNEPRLEQNVPNPFTNDSKISYFIPEISKVAQLHIFDSAGNIVDKIELKEKGEGYIMLNKGRYRSGIIYLYSLIVDGKIIDTKKFHVK